MLHKLKAYRDDIKQELDTFLSSQTHTEWEKEAIKRLVDIAKRGKLIRGSLILHASTAYGDKCDTKIAAGYELLHTGILAHDDIIDKDATRRGTESIPKQYSESPNGDGMAICVGDIAIVRGIRAIFAAKDYERTDAVLRLLKEVERTGGGQMGDITIMSEPSTVSKEEIISVFENKTAHYTLTAPLLVGLHPHISQEERQTIKQIGKNMGIAFQLRDDFLCYLPESQTGKAQFNDVKENKPTVIRLLMEEANPNIHGLYGKPTLTTEEANQLQQTFKEVKSEYEEDIATYKKKAEKHIKESSLDTQLQQDLLELNEFLCTRTR